MGRLYDAYVEVGPRFAGFGDIKKQGAQAGKEYGKALADAAAKAAAADVRKLGEALAKARSGEADAAGKVRVAEARLNEVRANGKSTVSQIAAAEESLASAQRKSAAASDSAKDAAEALGKAQKRVADQAETGGKNAGGRFSRAFRTSLSKIGGDREGKQFATRFGVGMNGAIGGIVSRSAGVFAAGFAAIKTTGFLKDAISGASDLGETTSKVQQIFGPAAQAIQKFSDTSASSLGQTRQAALDANATFGIFGKSAGLQGKGLSDFTTSLTTLAGDLASFNNTTPEQAIEAIGAALRGETEPIRAYGVLLDDASLRQEAMRKGLVKTTKEALTPQQKVLAAQSLIMKQTTTAQGDFARTSGGLANQQRILSASFSNFKTSLGAVALPLVTKIVTFLNTKGVPAFKQIKYGVEGFLSAFSGEGITSSGFVGFLEHIGVAARGAFGFFKTEVIPRLKEFGGFVISNVVPAVQNLISAFTPLAKEVGAGAVTVFQKLGPAAKSVGGFLAGALPAFKDFTGFLKDNKTLVGAVAVGIGAMVLAFKAYQGALFIAAAAGKAYAAVQAAINFVMDANPIGIVVLAVVGLAAGLVYAYKHSEKFRDIVNGVFNAVKGVVSGAIDGIKAGISGVVTAFDATKNAIGTAFSAVGTALDAVKSAFSAGVQFIGSVWSKIVDVVMGPVNVVIAVVKAVWPYISPILSLPFYIAKKAIDTAWAGIKAGFDAIAKFATSVFSVAWAVIKTVLVQPLVDGWHGIQKIWGYITTGFTVAKDWVVGKFSAAWAAVKNVLSGPVSLAKAAIDTVWGKIKGAFTAVKDWAVGAFSKTWSGLKAILTKPINDAKAAISTVLGAGKDGLQSVFSKAVTGIGTAWAAIKNVAKIPIDFVVNTVLNKGIIAGFNWIANKFQAPNIPNIPWPPKGWAAGGYFDGRLPGPPSAVDNLMGYSRGGRMFGLAGGEFVVNAKQTKKHLPTLQAMNAGMDGYADGGLIGSLGKGIKSAFNTGKNLVGDAADFLKKPFEWLSNKFAGPLKRLDELGNSTFVQTVKAIPKKIASTIADKAKSLIGIGSPIGGGGGPAPTNLSAMQALVRTVASQRGWGAGAEWDALYHLIMGESGFNPNAQNPTSTAYGLFQFLNSTWGSVGATKTSDPWGQTAAGLTYIARSYGDPINAYSKWSSRSPHWYNQGGLIPSYDTGTWAVPRNQLALVHKDEMVVPAKSAGFLRRLLPALSLHQLHEAHQAHTAHVAHQAHWNNISGRGRLLAHSRSSVAADRDVLSPSRLHPDDIRDLARALAGEIQANPPRIHLDGRRLDEGMTRRALNGGF